MTTKKFFKCTIVALTLLISACGGGSAPSENTSGTRPGVKFSSSVPISLKGSQTGDFTYGLNAERNGVVITGYTGNGGQVVI